MDNMVKTSEDISKLMTGMKPEEFADKMMNDTIFRGRYDKIEKIFFCTNRFNIMLHKGL